MILNHHHSLNPPQWPLLELDQELELNGSNFLIAPNGCINLTSMASQSPEPLNILHLEMILLTPSLLHARVPSQFMDQTTTLTPVPIPVPVKLPGKQKLQLQSLTQFGRPPLLSQIKNIKFKELVLNLTNNPSKLLDQRVISTLPGTGHINQVVLNGVLMVLMVSTTPETCQLKNLLDPTHHHHLLSCKPIKT